MCIVYSTLKNLLQQLEGHVHTLPFLPGNIFLPPPLDFKDDSADRMSHLIPTKDSRKDHAAYAAKFSR